jgi:hypothetical protein
MSLGSTKLERINELDIKISQPEEQLHVLRLERNRLTPLSTLPVEILTMICKHVRNPAKPQELITFMLACSHIYQAAVSVLHLWTSLHWLQNQHARSMCVLWSKGLPLHICWGAKEIEEVTSTYTHPWINNLFPSATSAFVHIPISSQAAEEEFMTKPAPCMRDLRVHSHDTSFVIQRDFLGGQLQNLRTLKLTSVTLEIKDDGPVQQWSCPAMRQLTISDCKAYFADIVCVVRSMPNLEVLNLKQLDFMDLLTFDNPPNVSLFQDVSLRRLCVLHLEQQLVDVGFLLSFLPDPSQHLGILITGPGASRTLPISSTEYTTVISCIQGFWQSVTGSAVLPHLKMSMKTTRNSLTSSSIEGLILTGAPYDCLSSEHLVEPTAPTAPSLFWSAPCTISIKDSSILPIINTLQFNMHADGLRQTATGVFIIDLLSGVWNVIIEDTFRPLNAKSGGCPNVQNQRSFTDWVRRQATAGAPLHSITFVGMKSQPDFTRNLVAAGGEDLRIVWHTKASNV